MVIKLDFSGADPQKKRTRTISRILLWTLRVCLILQFIFFCSTNTSRFANPELTLLDKPTTLLTYNISSTNTALPPWSSSQFSNTELTLYEKPSSLLTYNNTDFSSSEIHLDIGVPLAYNDERLVNTLCQSLGQAIGDYRNNNTRSVSFRLLVTRYANETTSEEFRLFLASKARLSKQDSVMFVPMSGKFNRAPALNGLFQAACELENCLFAGMDVDMQIQSSFIEHSIEYVMRSPDSRNGTIYFPIVWSAFEPKGVLVAEKIFGYLDTFSEHRGLWRETGHGMFVFQGPFTKILQMDEGFEGWGGEDCDFQNRTTKMGMRVVREHEPGLVHQWHEKSCIVGKDVTKRQLDACKTSAKTMEGTTFIRKLKQGKTFFQHLVDLPINSNNNTKRTTKQRSGKEARKWLSTMQSSFFNQTHAHDEDEPHQQQEKHNNLGEYGYIAACLYVNDENHRLPEWIAYHYHVAGLRRIIITNTPGCTSTPRPIMERWKDRINTTLWNEYGPKDIPFHVVFSVQHHRDNQQTFVAKYQQTLKKEGSWNWSFYIDPDEYFVINPRVRNPDHLLYNVTISSSSSLKIPSQREASSIPKLLKLLEPFRKDKSNPFLNTSPCLRCARPQFSNRPLRFVNDTDVWETLENISQGLDIEKMNTFRWLWRSDVYTYGKGIAELARVSSSDLETFRSIHDPIGKNCKSNKNWNDEEASPLLIHHYPANWLELMARKNIPMATKFAGEVKRPDKANMTALLEYRYQLESRSNGKMVLGTQDWLPGFIDLVGMEEAERLLQHVGNPELAKLGAEITWG